MVLKIRKLILSYFFFIFIFYPGLPLKYHIDVKYSAVYDKDVASRLY